MGQRRVSFDGLKQANVRLVFSVLYLPFAELDIDEWRGGKPGDHCYEDLIGGLEQDIGSADP